MPVKKYSRKNSSYRAHFGAHPSNGRWSKNELRTVMFVAALEKVPCRQLALFQRQLPSPDWPEGRFPERRIPMKDFLSWEPVQIDLFRKITLGTLIQQLLGMRSGVDDKAGIHADDVRTWMHSPDAQRLLSEVITMPHTALGVRLGHRPGSETIELYKRALALCSEPEEKAVFGASICIEDAADVLRRTIYEITPRSIYHSTNGNAAVVARALLSHEREVIERGDEIEVVKKEGEESLTVVISTTLKSEPFLDALKLPPDAIRWKRLKKRTDRKGSLMCDVRSNLRDVTVQR